MAAFLEIFELRFSQALRRLAGIKGPMRLQLDPALMPTVPMLADFELRSAEAWPRGWHGVVSRVILAQSVGNVNLVGLYNPPNSGMVAVLTRLDESSPGGLSVAQGTLGAATFGTWAHVDTRVQGITIPIVPFSVQQPGNIPPGMALVYGNRFRAPFVPSDSDPLWIVGPGFAVYYVSASQNVAADTNLAAFYRRVSLEDGF
jgi:hypothetical protein